MSNKRKILLLLFIALCIAVVGYYFYSLEPKNISGSNSIPITAVDLYRTYAKDSIDAHKQFTGKILLVKGVIASLHQNQQAQTVVSLKTNEQAAFINCSMEKGQHKLQVNDFVNVKGLCIGIGEADEALGIKADVYLTRCLVEN